MVEGLTGERGKRRPHKHGVHGGGFGKVVFRFGVTGDFETVRRSLAFLQPPEPMVTGDFRGRCVSFASG